jgi:hypothetical protein
MASGGYLMAVNKSSTETTAKIWLFVTPYQEIKSASTRWYFHNYVEVPTPAGAENMTFVTECDGTVFLLATSNPAESLGEDGVQNNISVFELVKNGDKLELSLRVARNTFLNDGFAFFRAAANFYVSPQGNRI